MTPYIFMLITLFSLVLFYYGIGKNKKNLILFSVLQLVIGTVVSTGLFIKKPHLFPMLILVVVLFVIYCLKKIPTQNINKKVLISIHVLRIPVEMVLFQLYLEHKIPKLMTYSGWNYDIAIGVSALIVLIYVGLFKKPIPKQLFMVWNVIGLIFLCFIVALSILSSPLMIQQLAFNQPNIAVTEFPYCFLPTCVVPIVFMSHLLLLRKNSPKLNITV